MSFDFYYDTTKCVIWCSHCLMCSKYFLSVFPLKEKCPRYSLQCQAHKVRNNLLSIYMFVY